MTSAQTVYEAWIQSYVATARQRSISQRQLVDTLPYVRYEYVWQGEHIQSENYFVWQHSPQQVERILAKRPSVPDRWLRVIEDHAGLRESYQALGYQLAAVEYMMVHPLDSIPALTTNYQVERIMNRQ